MGMPVIVKYLLSWSNAALAAYNAGAHLTGPIDRAGVQQPMHCRGPLTRCGGVVDELARQASSKLAHAACARDARLGRVPGGRPYREFGGVPFKPQVDEELCVRCGACVVQCPRGAREIGGGLALGAARKAFAVKCAKRQKSYLL